MITRENAPLSNGIVAAMACSSGPPCCASNAVIMSESVVARGWLCASCTIAATSIVFVRLPLCPSATPLRRAGTERKDGCAFSHLLDPVVEYRVCPIPM